MLLESRILSKIDISFQMQVMARYLLHFHSLLHHLSEISPLNDNRLHFFLSNQMNHRWPSHIFECRNIVFYSFPGYLFVFFYQPMDCRLNMCLPLNCERTVRRMLYSHLTRSYLLPRRVVWYIFKMEYHVRFTNWFNQLRAKHESISQQAESTVQLHSGWIFPIS